MENSIDLRKSTDNSSRPTTDKVFRPDVQATSITVNKEKGYGTITTGITIVLSMEDVHLILRETALPDHNTLSTEDFEQQYRIICGDSRIFLRKLAKKALADVFIEPSRTLEDIFDK